MRGARDAVATAVLLGSIMRASAAAPDGPIELRLVSESVYAQEQLTLYVNAQGVAGDASLRDAENPAPIVSHWNVTLSVDEAKRLRRLVRSAALFSGQFWGREERIASPKMALTIKSDGRSATLICSGNASFESGARRDLLALLLKVLRKDTQSGGHNELQRTRDGNAAAWPLNSVLSQPMSVDTDLGQ